MRYGRTRATGTVGGQPATVAPQRRSFFSRLTGPKTRPARRGERVYVEPVQAVPAHTHNNGLHTTHTHAHTHHGHSGPLATGPVVRQRRPSLGDKISGAMLRLRGSLSGRRGQKGAGTRRMRGTDGRTTRRKFF